MTLLSRVPPTTTVSTSMSPHVNISASVPVHKSASSPPRSRRELFSGGVGAGVVGAASASTALFEAETEASAVGPVPRVSGDDRLRRACWLHLRSLSAATGAHVRAMPR